MFKFSEKSLNNLEGVNSVLVEILKLAIIKSPIDFGIPTDGGLRTTKQQFELFNKGLSKADGYKVKSNHQTGNAVDVYAFVNGKASWDKIHLAIISGVIMTVAKDFEVNLRWGGTFGSDEFHGWDYPHFEIIE